MGLVVQHNLPAINAQNQMRVNLSNNQKASEKLSSGYRINRAGDDAAGLAISEKMRGQIRGLDQAAANAQDGISLVQTAEGALQETHSILQRMRELAVQSANGTYQNEVDRENIQKEADALKSEIDRIATSTHFNGKKLLDGSMSGTEVGGTGSVTSTVADSDAAAAIETENFDVGTATGISAIGISYESGLDNDAKDTVAQALNGATISVTSADISGTATYSYSISGVSGYTIDASTGKITNAAGDEVATVTKTGDATADGTATADIKGTAAVEVGDVTNTPSTPENGSGKLVLQIGANGAADQEVSLSVDDQSTKGLGIAAVNVSTRTDAKAAIASIDDAINSVSGTRADLGALQNRLEHTINNLSTSSENLTAAESRIRDTDMAKEMMNYTKSNILQQAAQAMLAQANVQPQSVLQLLG